MPEPPASSARLRHIGRTLQELREAKGWSQRRAGLRLERSGSSLSLIENGLQPLRVRDLNHILDVYEVTDRILRESLITLAEQDRQPGWWDDFRDVLSFTALDYVSLESDATKIDIAEPAFVPGLLQIEEYTRAIMNAGMPDRRLSEADLFVRFRMARQQILSRTDPPRLDVVLDEAVLRRLRGSRKVMRAQLNRLLDESTRENISIQVLPFSHPADPGYMGPFTTLGIGDPRIFSAVLIDHLSGRWILEEEIELTEYRAKFAYLRSVALSESSSRDLIHRIGSGL